MPAFIEGEKKLFSLRRAARSGQKDQLAKRVEQLKEEIAGYEAQERAKAREIELIEKQLVGARKLWDKQLMPVTRFTELQRDAARLEGEHGVLVATMAQIKGKISETELQILQVDRDLNSEIGKEMRESRYQDRRADRAQGRGRGPTEAHRGQGAAGSGMVDQSNVHTVGGVIAPGETIMLIVPDQDSLKVEAKVAPQDIDQLHIGQTVTLRFSGLDQRYDPGDQRHLDPRSRRTRPSTRRPSRRYYTVRVSLEPKRNRPARLGQDCARHAG